MPGAINCGVLTSEQVKCLADLKILVHQIAQRLLDELTGDPLGFFQNYSTAYNDSMAAWAEAVPGRLGDAVQSALDWVAGAAQTAWHAITNPGETYDKAVAATTDAIEAVANAYDKAKQVLDALSDPAKRDELLKKLEQWLNDQLADLGCDAAQFLLEAMQSKKPIAAQLGELKAALDQQAAEIAAQVAVAAATTKGLGAIASLASKGGRLGGLRESIDSVLNRAGNDAKVSERQPTPPTHTPKTAKIGRASCRERV